MTHTLQITPDQGDGPAAVIVQLGEIDPKEAALVVLKALADYKPKTRRSDFGRPRGSKTEATL